MDTRVLVAYATTHGSTREVAEYVASCLSERNFDVAVEPADQVHGVAGYDAVVLGGALYMGRWHREARRLLGRHQGALASMPVAVFALGPRTRDPRDVGESRRQLDRSLAKTASVKPFAVAIFGGVVQPSGLPFPLSRMPASDARDWDEIKTWAVSVARQLGYGKPASTGGNRRIELQQTPR
jgi:menaquinone-dependent protoporphyrinogen oxidase